MGVSAYGRMGDASVLRAPTPLVLDGQGGGTDETHGTHGTYECPSFPYVPMSLIGPIDFFLAAW